MGKLYTITLMAIIFTISHFMLLNAIDLKERAMPKKNIENFLNLVTKKAPKAPKAPQVKKDDNMKNELLEYVNNLSSKNNTHTKITLKDATNKVEGNKFYNNLADSSSEFKSNVTNIDDYFKDCLSGNCNFNPTPTQKNAEQKPVKKPEKVDKLSKESMYLSKTNDDKTQQASELKMQWSYDNEKVMNGGELFEGVMGYNLLDDQYALV